MQKKGKTPTPIWSGGVVQKRMVKMNNLTCEIQRQSQWHLSPKVPQALIQSSVHHAL